MTALRFDDRAVLITGAGRGLGRGYAKLLGRLGAHVTVNDFGGELDGSGESPGPARAVADEIVAEGGRAVANTGSVTSDQDVKAMIDQTLDEFGRIDAVICNAGILDNRLFGDYETEDVRRVMEVHFFGTLRVNRAAWPHLKKAGYGRIVNTTSSGMFGWENNSAYGAAKGAILGMTNNIALEGAQHGIKANCVAPSAATRMLTGAVSDPAQLKAMEAAMPPGLAAPAVAYLAHEDCHLTGTVLSAGGGHVHRWVVHQTQGYVNRDLTVDDVRSNLAKIRDDHTLNEVNAGLEISQILDTLSEQN